jgi:hypothetical protein
MLECFSPFSSLSEFWKTMLNKQYQIDLLPPLALAFRYITTRTAATPSATFSRNHQLFGK